MRTKKPEAVAAVLAAALIVYAAALLMVCRVPEKAPEVQQQVTERVSHDLSSRSSSVPRPVVVKAVVTAYTKDDPGMDGRGITYTGTKARRGVAAVDPEVIPLGSVLFVPGYGYARAEDTGGAIKGNRIDLYFESKDEAIKWGKKRLSVEVFSTL